MRVLHCHIVRRFSVRVCVRSFPAARTLHGYFVSVVHWIHMLEVPLFPLSAAWCVRCMNYATWKVDDHASVVYAVRVHLTASIVVISKSLPNPFNRKKRIFSSVKSERPAWPTGWESMDIYVCNANEAHTLKRSYSTHLQHNRAPRTHLVLLLCNPFRSLYPQKGVPVGSRQKLKIAQKYFIVVDSRVFYSIYLHIASDGLLSFVRKKILRIVCVDNADEWFAGASVTSARLVFANILNLCIIRLGRSETDKSFAAELKMEGNRFGGVRQMGRNVSWKTPQFPYEAWSPGWEWGLNVRDRSSVWRSRPQTFLFLHKAFNIARQTDTLASRRHSQKIKRERSNFFLCFELLFQVKRKKTESTASATQPTMNERKGNKSLPSVRRSCSQMH